MTIKRSWVLARRPTGAVRPEDFTLTSDVWSEPSLAEGQILVNSLIFSCAPTIRNWLNAPERSYRASTEIGQPIMGMGAAEVIRSQHPDFQIGDRVTAVLPWQDYAVLTPGRAAVPIVKIPREADIVDAMSIHSLNSLTAYFGLTRIAEVREGQTVLVSGAAGSVGAVACQIARILGCRVVGIAGGPDKCAWLVETCGVAAAIDYREGDVAERVAAACPEGVDAFFDNVGGELLDAAVAVMKPRGRIALCGQIAAYDSGLPAAGPSDMMRLVYGQLRVEGFLVGSFVADYATAHADIGRWAAEGKIITKVDLRHGFEKLPAAFVDLFGGRNDGTLLVAA